LNEVRDFNSNYSKGVNIKFNLIYKFDKEYYINANLYKDFKLMIYEIHNNIMKHSNAQNVTTTVIVSSNKLEIHIVDDGVLTDIRQIEKKGNGIANIRKRVERNYGEVSFLIPTQGHGLEIIGIFTI
jgi:signal transduction histidine kinase